MRSWLVLIHHVPPKPDYLRVKFRRRLQQLGAVALRNSVYVLPKTDETLEDFHWLRREIIADDGEALLIHSSLLEGTTDGELEARFHAARNEEYAAVTEALINASSAMEVHRMQRQLADVRRRDYFDAAGRQHAEAALRDWTRRLAGPSAESETAIRVTRPTGAVWVTRRGAKVDRIASAWLVRRWIDSAARFKFVEPSGYAPAPGELRFDMYEGEFTHQGERCTFETLLHHFAIDDAALRVLAEIVHDIDCKDQKYQRAESAGIAIVIEGIVTAHAEDENRLKAGFEMLDALYATLQRRIG